MGTGFLMDIDIFHGYGFGTVKPSGFVPVAISSPVHSRRAGRRPGGLLAFPATYASSSSATAPSAPAARRPRVPLRFSAGAGCSGGDGGPWGLHLLPFLSGLIPVNFIDHTKRPSKTTTTRPSMPYLLPSDHGDSAVTMRSCQQLPAEDAQ